MEKGRIRPLREGEGAECERILRGLPDWFGIEEAIVSYRRDIDSMETYVMEVENELVGFLTLKTHNRYSAEIQVIAVRNGHHGKGYGRALVEHAERLLEPRSVEFFQVKTVGPSLDNEPYARTRGFYLKLGFRPLEENRLWGEDNPCLIMVKRLP